LRPSPLLTGGKRVSAGIIDILEIMEDRYGARSTIITTQFPIDTWHDIIGDPTLADAICDRVIHNAHKIMLKPGEESMRKIHSTLTEGRTLLQSRSGRERTAEKPFG